MDTNESRKYDPQNPQRNHKVIGFPVHIAGRFMSHLLCALRYLKSVNVLHTDLKPENIMVDVNQKFAKERQMRVASAAAATEELFALARQRNLEGALGAQVTNASATRVPPLSTAEKNAIRARDAELSEDGWTLPSLKCERIDDFFMSAVAKLADFGEVQRAPLDFPTHGGKRRDQLQPLWYRAPEVFLGDWPLTSAMDMWSFGITSWTLATGEPVMFDAPNTPGAPPHYLREEHAQVCLYRKIILIFIDIII